MVDISKEVFKIVTRPAGLEFWVPADKQGQPNAAYFGSTILRHRKSRGIPDPWCADLPKGKGNPKDWPFI